MTIHYILFSLLPVKFVNLYPPTLIKAISFTNIASTISYYKHQHYCYYIIIYITNHIINTLYLYITPPLSDIAYSFRLMVTSPRFYS